MPVQQQMSSFAKRLGVKVAQANAEHASKPIDTGNRRLPAGIRNGIAKLSTMYTKEQTEDNAKTPKGESFFRASAIIMTPLEHNGEKVEGLVTQQVIPLCDVPAKGMRKAKSFSDNWYEFQNLFKMLGIAACPETPQTDPTGQRTEAYFFAAMKTLTDPVRLKTNPVYISFSTRGFTPPATPAQPKPEEMVFEEWHGLATPDQSANIRIFNPAVGVTEHGVTNVMPPPVQPPTNIVQVSTPPTQPPQTPSPQNHPPQEPEDRAELVAALVDAAMTDPDGATQEGTEAHSQLEELAWAVGWTKEQTAGAADWVAVGGMALNPPNDPTGPPQNAVSDVAAGTRWMFCKRTKDGEKLKNNNGEAFPSQEVEVTTTNPVDETCTVKNIKDGKDVVDIRTKKPVAVKWEWLEPAPAY